MQRAIAPDAEPENAICCESFRGGGRQQDAVRGKVGGRRGLVTLMTTGVKAAWFNSVLQHRSQTAIGSQSLHSPSS